VVRLAEGPSISGQIVGVDAAHPETIRVGMPVRMVVVPPEAVTAPSGGGATIANRLVFEPAEG
jgi:uncharacterized OB-fold protein